MDDVIHIFSVAGRRLAVSQIFLRPRAIVLAYRIGGQIVVRKSHVDGRARARRSDACDGHVVGERSERLTLPLSARVGIAHPDARAAIVCVAHIAALAALVASDAQRRGGMIVIYVEIGLIVGDVLARNDVLTHGLELVRGVERRIVARILVGQDQMYVLVNDRIRIGRTGNDGALHAVAGDHAVAPKIAVAVRGRTELSICVGIGRRIAGHESLIQKRRIELLFVLAAGGGKTHRTQRQRDQDDRQKFFPHNSLVKRNSTRDFLVFMIPYPTRFGQAPRIFSRAYKKRARRRARRISLLKVCPRRREAAFPSFPIRDTGR